MSQFLERIKALVPGHLYKPVDLGTTTYPMDCVTPIMIATATTTTNFLALPFDMAREQYARSVSAGLIERSMLASANFGRTLYTLEKLTLGPWARSV
jgi:hypothetical protein